MVFILLLFAFALLAEPSFAQCPMCKASVEASMKEGSNVARGLNHGILYLLSMPYLIFCVLFLLWYRNWKKVKQLGINN